MGTANIHNNKQFASRLQLPARYSFTTCLFTYPPEKINPTLPLLLLLLSNLPGIVTITSLNRASPLNNDSSPFILSYTSQTTTRVRSYLLLSRLPDSLEAMSLVAVKEALNPPLSNTPAGTLLLLDQLFPLAHRILWFRIP